ncbi:uncharacterized protein LOC143301019 [Babylonia areolata]|uniref:uncharacterized protein LOC143301019 n=1 Tax=Babylonia areolata TaxID=304850 RepID=UPI003FD1822F
MNFSVIFFFTTVCVMLADMAAGAIAPGAACTTKDSGAECVDNAMCKNVAPEGQAESLQCTCSAGFHDASGACVADISAGIACTTKDSGAECVDNAMCKNVAPEGQAESLQCTCSAGFHDESGACVADIAAGAACTTKDSGVECVDNAMCKNVAPEGQAESLQCTCSAGFHDASGACVADIAAGAACTTRDSGAECVDNAMCRNKAAEGQAEFLLCTCNAGFHYKSGACVAAAGGACTTKDSGAECVDNAMCKNVAPEGQAESLQCTCSAGFHDASGACVADIAAGAACTTKDSGAECVDNAMCKNVAPEGQAESLQCTCSAGFHDASGACVADMAAEAIAAGAACTTKDSGAECVDNAMCKNVAPEGQAESLQCTCSAGFHDVSGACVSDISAGIACTTKDSGAECVDNAMCKNVAPEGQAESLQCTCSAGFHDASGACVADIAAGAACNTVDSPTECVENAVCKNVAAEGETESLQCTCNSGYLDVSGTCYVAAGGTCTTVDSTTECVDNAMCKNVAPEGQAESLQCTCSAGFHGASGACVADIAAGAACNTVDSTTQCVDNAVCKNVAAVGETESLQCTCNSGYLDVSGTCFVAAGGTCTTVDSTTECVDNAMCKNAAAEGQAESLQCTCSAGFHDASGACVADIAAGAACTTKDSDAECVDNAMCKNVAPEGQAESLQCTCNVEFHDESGACVADECQDTVDKCKAAGMSSCTEIITYTGCLLTGVCTAEVADVAVFRQALQSTQLPDDCSVTEQTTCAQNVTSCLISHLKSVDCTTIDSLGTCLSPLNATCTEEKDAAAFSLAHAYYTHMKDNFSCACLKEVNDCKETSLAVLNSTDDSADKCGAVKDLFLCAMTDECDVTKEIDQSEVRLVWSLARASANATNCHDTLTKEAATSCKLQLTRCALVYGAELQNAADKSRECRAGETLGSCLMDDTAQCTAEDAAKKKPFTDQYTAVSSTCVCENDINKCIDQAGVVPSDPHAACPKLQKFVLCLTGAKCDLTQNRSPLSTAFSWYTQNKTSHNCSFAADNTCASGAAVCADHLFKNLTKDGVTSAQICQADSNSILCVQAANCSTDSDDDVQLMASARNGSVFRLASLPCAVLSCNATYQVLRTCNDAFNEDFTAADTDTSKCTAVNNMVRCMRSVQCNFYLSDLRMARYKELEAIDISGCDMLPLEEPESAAPSLHTSLLPLLASLLIGYIAVRL